MGLIELIVIDYLVGNEEGCNIVEEMEVKYQTDSDYAALEMKIEGEVRMEVGEKWKIRRDKEAIAKYQERLGELMRQKAGKG